MSITAVDAEPVQEIAAFRREVKSGRLEVTDGPRGILRETLVDLERAVRSSGAATWDEFIARDELLTQWALDEAFR